jgi:hypothetical protein
MGGTELQERLDFYMAEGICTACQHNLFLNLPQQGESDDEKMVVTDRLELLQPQRVQLREQHALINRTLLRVSKGTKIPSRSEDQLVRSN